MDLYFKNARWIRYIGWIDGSDEASYIHPNQNQHEFID